MNIFSNKRYNSQRRYHKLLDTLTTKKQRYIKQKSRNIRERKKYIIILIHFSENILSSAEKIRSILSDVINNLNRIDLYLIYINHILHKYI